MTHVAITGASSGIGEALAREYLRAGAHVTLVARRRDHLERIAREVEAEIPGVRLAAAHRVGALSVGDAAVICAASAEHRGEAFRACRRLIDAIKARVPVWKREWGPDGPYWVGWEDARCHDAGDHGAHGHR